MENEETSPRDALPDISLPDQRRVRLHVDNSLPGGSSLFLTNEMYTMYTLVRNCRHFRELEVGIYRLDADAYVRVSEAVAAGDWWARVSPCAAADEAAWGSLG
ncbi:MAG: hypothetical protein QME87_07750 [Bacillota bacterium]|nr:hypothetical protein [Bacillota bacterium]